MKRCSWCNLKNEKYVEYHDKKWGKLNLDDNYLFKMLLLESFQAGLSWEIILNKEEAFDKAYDSFDLNKVCSYDDEKINELICNKDIIRNRLKITASIKNANVFRNIKEKYGSFKNYLTSFTNNKIYYETGKVFNDLSDEISKDLKMRGMSFVGSKIIYSYLQAIGIIYSHEEGCFLYKQQH